MKKYLFAMVLGLLSLSASAKKVRFSVDMADQTISALGVHVMGDFQDEAGFINGDWQPNTVLMTPNADSTIFSIVVEIPAFRKYEYRFINGDQSYETEFIPVPSRVGYDFIDNRWIYIDSLANDTTDIGAIVFGGNAPRGFNLMRFLVQMPTSIAVASEGVHVIGDFQNWDLTQTYMYSFVPDIYEVIAYDTLGNHQYLFVNGESMEGQELGMDSCFVNQLRSIQLQSDSVLLPVCFDQCAQTCANPVGVSNNNDELFGNIYPNPSTGEFNATWRGMTGGKILIWNAQGQLKHQAMIQGNSWLADFSNLGTGEYIVQFQDAQGKIKQIKKWSVVR
ncbi:MAG: hypothetical protein RL609_1712 [Bacteroidota bacterium]|jgi:hypothetical protein